MTAEIVPIRPASVEALIEVALATCESPETRRAYSAQLRKFIASGQPLTREGVAFFLQSEREAGKGFAVLQSVCSAIRKLAAEANIRGLLSDAETYAIGKLKPGKGGNRRIKRGNWLTLSQVDQLLSLPNRETYLGKRDAALLSILVGCGLRRDEIVNLRWTHYAQREGRYCLVDFQGKGRRVRTVPVPAWAAADIDAWKSASLDEGPRSGNIGSLEIDRDMIFQGMGVSNVWKLVDLYSTVLGIRIAPHDLRRTLAQLLRRSGAPLEQIQHTLGHSNINTTQVYLGASLELRSGDAAVDRIRLVKKTPVAPATPNGGGQ